MTSTRPHPFNIPGQSIAWKLLEQTPTGPRQHAQYQGFTSELRNAGASLNHELSILRQHIEYRRHLLFSEFDPILTAINWANLTFGEFTKNCLKEEMSMKPRLQRDIEKMVPKLLHEVRQIATSYLGTSEAGSEHETQGREQTRDAARKFYQAAKRAQKEPELWEDIKNMISESVPPAADYTTSRKLTIAFNPVQSMNLLFEVERTRRRFETDVRMLCQWEVERESWIRVEELQSNADELLRDIRRLKDDCARASFGQENETLSERSQDQGKETEAMVDNT